jgi:hypothetical protein
MDIALGLLVVIDMGLLGCAMEFRVLGLGARVIFLLEIAVTGDIGAGVLRNSVISGTGGNIIVNVGCSSISSIAITCLLAFLVCQHGQSTIIEKVNARNNSNSSELSSFFHLLLQSKLLTCIEG